MDIIAYGLLHPSGPHLLKTLSLPAGMPSTDLLPLILLANTFSDTAAHCLMISAMLRLMIHHTMLSSAYEDQESYLSHHP